MHEIPQLLRRAGIALAFTAFTASGHAAIIQQDRSFNIVGGGPLDEIEKIGVNETGSLTLSELRSFDYFDPALGALSSVKWVLTGARAAFDIDHRASVATTLDFPFQFIVDFDLAAKDQITGTAGADGLRGTGGLSFNLLSVGGAGCGFDPPVPVPPGLGNVVGCHTQTHGLNEVLSDSLAADPSLFLGSGTFDQKINLALDWDTRVDAAIANTVPPPIPPANIFKPADVFGDFGFRGTLSLVYEFSPADPPPPTSSVPVPATPLLLGAGLAGLLAGRRRKKKR